MTLLGIEVPEDTDYITGKPNTIITDELTILATVRPVGAWGGALAGDESITSNSDRLQAAVNSRMNSISEALRDADVPTISLVEIKGKKSYTGKQRAADPKFAIKVGLSRTGRLAQCVTEAPQPEQAEDGQDASSSDASLEKMVNSWYDLLRQLGVRASNLPIQLGGTQHHRRSGIPGVLAHPPEQARLGRHHATGSGCRSGRPHRTHDPRLRAQSRLDAPAPRPA
ncbi:hypothetical protein [Actinocrispum wychmicini]|uniref:hypothetical protein n=1 Tax=Actinocrispum wychmicini TaxID=1213861 RepID=UPI001404F83F|nr:hypothetical protein [Actinocrispum wychmicini]